MNDKAIPFDNKEAIVVLTGNRTVAWTQKQQRRWEVDKYRVYQRIQLTELSNKLSTGGGEGNSHQSVEFIHSVTNYAQRAHSLLGFRIGIIRDLSEGTVREKSPRSFRTGRSKFESRLSVSTELGLLSVRPSESMKKPFPF